MGTPLFQQITLRDNGFSPGILETRRDKILMRAQSFFFQFFSDLSRAVKIRMKDS
jgi:hypothetical protein